MGRVGFFLLHHWEYTSVLVVFRRRSILPSRPLRVQQRGVRVRIQSLLFPFSFRRIDAGAHKQTQPQPTPTKPPPLISSPIQLHRYICLEKGAALPCANIYAIQDCNDVERCVFYEDIYKCWDKEQKLQCDELNYYGEASCTKHDCTSTRLYAMARVSSKKGRERGR